jgi:leader peptidase (prepilin peptidase)/N-methyltransferase
MELSSLSSFLQIYILVLTGIFGLVIGSFLNVVILRLFSGESIVFPCSKCPKCSHPIAWYDNIPVIGYIMLRGKCRNCKESISIQYPLVEISTAILFVLTVLTFGIALKSFFLLILISALIVITVTDLKEQVIFDITSVPLIPLGLIYNFFNIANVETGHIKFFALTFNDVFLAAVGGAILGALLFELFARLGTVLVGHRAFGEGDTIIAAALGAWFGWKALIAIIALSLISQLFIGIPLILFNMYKNKDFKSFAYMSILIFSMVLSITGKIFGFTENMSGALFITIACFVLAIIGVIGVLSAVRERKSHTLLPFGPSLVLGGLILLFAGNSVINFFIKHLFVFYG